MTKPTPAQEAWGKHAITSARTRDKREIARLEAQREQERADSIREHQRGLRAAFYARQTGRDQDQAA